MRETDRTQGLGGLFMVTAFRHLGGVNTAASDRDHRDQNRNGSRIRSAPIRRNTSDSASVMSTTALLSGSVSVSTAGGENVGKAAWEDTPYVRPMRKMVPRRHCLTPTPDLPLSTPQIAEGDCGDDVDGKGEKARTGREAVVKGTAPIADPQGQSGLFRLPRALRVLIYKEVLGCKVLKITGGLEGKLGCVPCGSGFDGLSEEKLSHEQKNTTWLSDLDVGGGDEVSVNRKYENERQGGTPRLDFLSLMQSCRGIYVDAMPLLYTSTTFAFTTMEAVIAFSLAIPACRFDSINSLLISFTYDLSNPTGFSIADMTKATPRSNWPRWQRTWRIVDSMAGLKTLKVRLEWGKALFAEEEERLLGPLCGVKGLRVFEVEVGRLKTGEHGRFTREERETIRLHKRMGIKKVEKAREVPFSLVRKVD